MARNRKEQVCEVCGSVVGYELTLEGAGTVEGSGVLLDWPG